MDPPPQVPAEIAGHTDTLRWRPFAWWRTVLAVVPVLLWVATAFPFLRDARAPNDMAGLALFAWLLFTALAAFVALPSAVIAPRAFRRRRSAVYIALVHDAVILAIVAWFTACAVRNPLGIEHVTVAQDAAPWLVAGVFFGAEAAYLLRAAFARRLAWLAPIVFMAAAISAVGIAPPLINAWRLAHVRPLLRYADTHWFAIPAHARITVGLWPYGGTGGHLIRVVGRRCWWTVAAARDGNGRWIPPRNSRGPEAFPENPTRASAADQALGLLTKCGVADRHLRLEQAVTDPITHQTTYRFRSSLAQGSFEVSGGGRISFVWEQPLNLDQSGRRR